EAAFGAFDVLVSPTSPTTAFPIGAKIDDPLAMYLNDVFTIPANLSGMPAISIPSGVDRAGLPVGLQLTAPVLTEPTLLRVANALEASLGFHARPALIAALGFPRGAPSRHDQGHPHHDEDAGEQRAGRERLVQDQRAHDDGADRRHVRVGRDERGPSVAEQPQVAGEADPRPHNH